MLTFNSRLLISTLMTFVLGFVPTFAQIQYQTFTIPKGVNTVNGISGNNVVGEIEDAGLAKGFLYNGSSYTTIQDPNANNATLVRGVSGSTVVGTYINTASGDHGFTYNNGIYTDINDPSGTGTIATAIDGTNIIGTSVGSSAGQQGFLDQNGVFSVINVPTGSYTQPLGISGDTIVGTYIDPINGESGFTFENGVYTTLNDPLGTGGTVLTGISGNDIVGYYFVETTPTEPSEVYGFIYDGSQFTTISDPLAAHDTSGAEGTYVYGISGNKVAGTYFTGGIGSEFGFIATVPEPRSVVLWVVGFGLIVVMRARRKVS